MTSVKSVRKAYSKLIRKDDVGKSKAPRYELPGPDFVYGSPPGDLIEGAKLATTNWEVHRPSPATPQKKNFKLLNKISVKAGLSTARSFRQVTKINDIRVTPKVGTKVLQLVLPDEDFSYGVPNRSSTPVKSVIYNEYGNDAAADLENVYKRRLAETYNTPKVRPKTTKNAELVMQSTVKKIKDLNFYDNNPSFFKMKKFLNPKPKVDTINRNYTPATSKRPQTASNAQSINNRQI